MRPGAHIKAAAEVLDEVLERHRPAASALSDWGKSHRFAGSGDRSAIGNLVYDALRRRRSLAAQMGADTPARACARPPLRTRWDYPPQTVAAAADGSPHALEPLSEAEQAGPVAPGAGRCAAPRCAATIPTGWSRRFARAFGEAAAEEGAALAPPRARRPARQHAEGRPRQGAEGAGALLRRSRRRCRRSACALPAPDGPGRQPNVEAEIGHGKGWYEVQDEGSQIAALMAVRRSARAGARYLCRRRRQDAGACRGHAQHRPGLRLRRRHAAAAPDLRAAEAGRRAQRAGAAGRRRRRRLRRSAPASTWCSSMPPAPARAPGAGGPTPSGG